MAQVMRLGAPSVDISLFAIMTCPELPSYTFEYLRNPALLDANNVVIAQRSLCLHYRLWRPITNWRGGRFVKLERWKMLEDVGKCWKMLENVGRLQEGCTDRTQGV
jgi:hypothetical protein